MRLWTLHPQYLDSKGLLALWREALLAKKVLTITVPQPHPVFRIVAGGVRAWERIGTGTDRRARR